jgi:crossover junction endodeoxyribonuclease RusA
MSATLYLPYPPSVNTYWRANGKRRFISKAGVEFKQAVADYVISNSVPKFGDSRLRLDIIIQPRSRRAFDLDNTCKAIFDSMMDAGVYEDDSQIDEFTIRRGVATKNGGCIVVIEEING